MAIDIKHLCATCKTGISTLSLRINEHPYWIKLRYVQSTHTCVQIYCGKYHFKQFNNKWVILKKCALLTGGLEVSFSIYRRIYYQEFSFTATYQWIRMYIRQMQSLIMVIPISMYRYHFSSKRQWTIRYSIKPLTCRQVCNSISQEGILHQRGTYICAHAWTFFNLCILITHYIRTVKMFLSN